MPNDAIDQAASQQPRIDLKNRTAEAALDGDLPDASRAEYERTGLIFQ
jgi:hypothetical protein